MTNRAQQIETFLLFAGWGKAERKLLAGDASFRRYDRLTMGSDVAVLMDAPPPMEDVRPFIKVAEHLENMGYSVPHIIARDNELGLLLLEDLGDDTYTRLLARGANEDSLYNLAMDVLADIARHPDAKSIDVPAYNDDKLLTEAKLLTDWYLPDVGVDLSADALAQHDQIWRDLFPIARGVPDGLVLRDFHVDNLLLLKRDDIKACGLLDFQDAVIGPVTYDSMSLLEDARRDIRDDLFAREKERFRKALNLDPAAFEASWAVMAAQRHAKVIGIFTRLKVRDNKPIYLGHIPRVWRLLERALQHPALAPLKSWMDQNVPQDKRAQNG